ncbi:MAG: CinA family protein [Acholeplasmataceae bacterium]|nr:MAG: CinA family protein [Acholeplasmataceae bacterium]
MTTQQCLTKLSKKSLTIACAESISGGALAFECVRHAGASKVFKGGIIAYHPEIKIRQLGISRQDITAYGIVSAEIAVQMAQSIRTLYQADIGLATTGNAGPSTQEGVGRREAWIAIVTPDTTITKHLVFERETRLQAIKKTVDTTYQKLLETI